MKSAHVMFLCAAMLSLAAGKLRGMNFVLLENTDNINPVLRTLKKRQKVVVDFVITNMSGEPVGYPFSLRAVS